MAALVGKVVLLLEQQSHSVAVVQADIVAQVEHHQLPVILQEMLAQVVVALQVVALVVLLLLAVVVA